MRPSKALVFTCILFFLAGIGTAFLPTFKTGFLIIAAMTFLLAIIDFALGFRKPKLNFKRNYQKRYALGAQTVVNATITNRSKLRLKARIYDGIPDYCEHDGYPYPISLKPSEYVTFSPILTFRRRGDMTFSPAHVEVSSPLRLWWKRSFIGESQTVQVYPDYMPALQYGLLATSDRAQQMGIIKKRYQGASKEFHQLRDYQDGDSLNTIDWKATSRVNRVISREFQEERDQNILLVADCSTRTRSIDQNLPILDHILNAMILVSYIAINQGDKVSVMNYGTLPEELRHLPAVKGSNGMSSILNHLYNYQPSKSYGEYEALTQRILAHQKKRSLIIILTNLRSEDQYGCVEALQLLRKKHVVLLASIQESSVHDILQAPISSTREANRYLGANAYEQDAQEIVNQLRKAGASVMRSPLDNFAVNLANQFLDIRSEISA